MVTTVSVVMYALESDCETVGVVIGTAVVQPAQQKNQAVARAGAHIAVLPPRLRRRGIASVALQEMLMEMGRVEGLAELVLESRRDQRTRLIFAE